MMMSAFSCERLNSLVAVSCGCAIECSISIDCEYYSNSTSSVLLWTFNQYECMSHFLSGHVSCSVKIVSHRNRMNAWCGGHRHPLSSNATQRELMMII
jgi:hypothetical protein